MREIVTLQLGAFSNFVGAHFWNIQDELVGLEGSDGPFQRASSHIEVGTLLRERASTSGQSTMTPRCVMVDKRGALGSWSPHGTLVGPGVDPTAAAAAASSGLSTWTGAARHYLASAEPKSDFTHLLEAEGQAECAPSASEESPAITAARHLERQARHFTDFTKPYLSAQSVLQLPAVWWGTSPFTSWQQCSDVLASEELRDGLEEAIRRETESCDSLQGFHVLFDHPTGFSALACHALQYIADDVGHTVPALVHPVEDFPAPDDTAPDSEDEGVALQARLGHGLTLAALVQQRLPLVVAPLSARAVAHLPHLDRGRLAAGVMGAAGAYLAGAPLASALDCLTTPARAVGPAAASLRDVVSAVAGPLGPVAVLAASTPCPSIHDPVTPVSVLRTPGPPPGLVAESVSARGLAVDGGVVDAGHVAEALGREAVREAQERGRGWVRYASVCPVPQPVPATTPGYFAPHLTADGLTSSGRDGEAGSACSTGRHVRHMPVLTRLMSCWEAGELVRRARDGVQGALRSRRGRAVVKEWGMEEEALGDMAESLGEVWDTYRSAGDGGEGGDGE